jgi:hypothetical protein
MYDGVQAITLRIKRERRAPRVTVQQPNPSSVTHMFQMPGNVWDAVAEQGARVNHILYASQSKWRTIGIRDVFCYRIPTKTRFESSTLNFKPHLLNDTAFQAGVRGPSSPLPSLKADVPYRTPHTGRAGESSFP